jgi:hypothetical protein
MQTKTPAPRSLSLLITVQPLGLTELGAKFDMKFPYTGCRICGAISQTDEDRHAKTPRQTLDAYLNRLEWRRKHSRTHPQHMHDQLERSGAYMTPEAASRLASYGIISVADMALIDEHWHAGRESPRIPANDVEGGA